MLRVRFHGRGGHGVKTASRILGTAAFLGGLYVQDFPLYGAERRGAAVTAFTRIDTALVCERGVIHDPDLIVVADETLLADPAAGVLTGRESVAGVFVNSSQPGSVIAGEHGLVCPVRSLDLTALTAELLGRLSALSAPLGAVACALTGMVSAEVLEQAVQQELTDVGLPADAIERNVEAARRAFATVVALDVSPERPTQPPRPRVEASALHVPVSLAGPTGVPVIYAAGNASARHTGSWRLFRPEIDRDVCTRCGICYVLCPDAAITQGAEGYPVIDHANCKGCLICVRECPLHCIAEEREVGAW